MSLFPLSRKCDLAWATDRKATDPVILRKKAQKKRTDTGDNRWKAPIEKSNKSMVRTVGYSLLRPFQILAYEPMALILNLYSAILLGILYLFFGAFPLVFEGVFGFNLWQTGLTFLGMLLGMFFAAMSSGFWVVVRARLIEQNGGKLEPEFRLPALMAGSMFVTVGLFWFAWTTFSWVHWILPIIGSGIFGLGVSSFPLVACKHKDRVCGGWKQSNWIVLDLGSVHQSQSLACPHG